MSKFNKKLVSLASSLLAFTSLSGPARAMVVQRVHNPYANHNGDPAYHTAANAWKATTRDYDAFMGAMNDGDKNILRDAPFYAVNRVSNHRIATGIILATALGGGALYESGALDGLLDGQKNSGDTKEGSDDDESTTDTTDDEDDDD